MRELNLVLLALGAGFLGSLLNSKLFELVLGEKKGVVPARKPVAESVTEIKSIDIPPQKKSYQPKFSTKKPFDEKKSRPVVFVVSDDLRATSIDKEVTPSLWKFSEGAFEFQRAYCQAPACNPSRNSFLTGHMPDASKVYAFEATTEDTLGARGAATFFSEFRKMGYRSYAVGKIFHWAPYGEPFSRNLPDGARFEYFPRDYSQEWGYEGSSSQDPLRSKPRKCFSHQGQCHLNNAQFLPEADYRMSTLFDERVADVAIDLFRQVSTETKKPFILGIGFHHPHLVWLIPKRFSNLSHPFPEKPPKKYAADLVKTSPYYAFGDVALGTTAELRLRDGTIVKHFAERHPPMPHLEDKAAIEMRASYRAAVRVVDEQFGKIMQTIDDSTLADDTIIVFTADHGYGLGERHGHWGKSALYEISTRVPLYIRDTQFSMSTGHTIKHPVELIDIFKTMIDLASPSYDPLLYKHIDGNSLRKLMKRANPNDNGEHGFDKSIAITMMPKCPKTAWSIPFGCGGKSMSWPDDALLGFAARSANFRYVAWMQHNHTLDAIDWSQLPVAEELFDHRNLDPRDPDQWELVNLLAPAKLRASSAAVRSYIQRAALSDHEIRTIANTHLRLLRERARQRMTNTHGAYPFRFHNDIFPRHTNLNSGFSDRHATDLYTVLSAVSSTNDPKKESAGAVSIFAPGRSRYHYTPTASSSSSS